MANQIAVIMHVPAWALVGSERCAPPMLCLSRAQPAGGGQALGQREHHRPDLELRLNRAALARMCTSAFWSSKQQPVNLPLCYCLPQQAHLRPPHVHPSQYPPSHKPALRKAQQKAQQKAPKGARHSCRRAVRRCRCSQTPPADVVVSCRCCCLPLRCHRDCDSSRDLQWRRSRRPTGPS
jgi:hypothetical protein